MGKRTMMRAALATANKGWAVFPCNPETKAPLTKHGHLEATRAPHIIHEWWSEWPDAMIGGKVPDNLLVLDIDPRNGGSYLALELMVPDKPGILPQTLEVISGRGDGGRHLYFKRPDPVRLPRLTGSALPPGIDLKVNGYLIMPPSLHPATGEPYRWVPRPVKRLPPSFVALLIPPPRMPRVPSGDPMDASRLAFTVANAPAGERNSILYWAACRAAEDGASDDVFDALVDAARAAGLSEKEAQRTIESAQTRV